MNERRWVEYIGLVESLVIRIGGLILISLFIGRAIAEEWQTLLCTAMRH